MHHNYTLHQQKQIEIINSLENTSRQNPNYSVVTPVADFTNDPRLCLTSVNIPEPDFANKIVAEIISPLKLVDPGHFYYSTDNLHLTIKNVRVINDPPHFNSQDETIAASIFSTVVPQHHSFKIYYYRLLVLSTSLALVGTTDPELDNIILDLDDKLATSGVPDDKVLINKQYFFSNICLARFTHTITPEFQQAIQQISQLISFSPYLVNSVTLLVCNGVFQKRRILGTWKLKDDQ